MRGNLNETAIGSEPRECGTCSKCCEGWLHGSANGKKFWRGRPCHYFDGKCTIYGNHPEDPCKIFRCQWLADNSVPGWMRPDRVNAILVKRRKNDIDYLEINEAGEKLRVEVLSWAVMYCLENKLNLQYTIDGGMNRVGSQEFLSMAW